MDTWLIFLFNTGVFLLWLVPLTLLFLAIQAIGTYAVSRWENADSTDGNLAFILGLVCLGTIVLAATYVMIYVPFIDLPLSILAWGGVVVLIWRYRQKVLPWLKSPRYLLFAAAFMVLMLFLFGIFRDPTYETPANNFKLGLLPDYRIALMLAESIQKNELIVFGDWLGTDHPRDWLGSDRPPLMSGFILLFSVPPGALSFSYLTIGTGLQLLSIPTVYAIASICSAPRRAPWLIAAIAMALALSPLYVHNISFLWPKILSGIFQLIAVYLVFFRPVESRRDIVFIGATLALAFLSHNGGAYAIIAIGLGYLVLNLKWRAIYRGFGIVGVFLTLNIPWLFFQKVIQPPGDRLLKWHLLGQVEVTSRGFFEVAATQYQGFGLSDLWDRFLTSLNTQILQPYGSVFRGVFGYGTEIAWAQTSYALTTVANSYSFTTSAIGPWTVPMLFVLGATVLSKVVWRSIFVWLLVTLVWFIVPFRGAHSVFAGTYAVQMLPFVALAIAAAQATGWRIWLARGAVVILAVQAAVQLWLFWDLRAQRIADPPDPLGIVQSVEGDIGGKDFYRTTRKGRVVYGSYLSSDADTANLTIHLTDAQAIRYRTGPDATGQTLRVTDASGEVLLELTSKGYLYWTLFRFPLAPEATLILQDTGKGYGQWSAVEVDEPYSIDR